MYAPSWILFFTILNWIDLIFFKATNIANYFAAVQWMSSCVEICMSVFTPCKRNRFLKKWIVIGYCFHIYTWTLLMKNVSISWTIAYCGECYLNLFCFLKFVTSWLEKNIQRKELFSKSIPSLKFKLPLSCNMVLKHCSMMQLVVFLLRLIQSGPEIQILL